MNDMQVQTRKRIWRSGLVAGIVGLVLTGVVVAEDVWVKSDAVDIRDDPSAFGNVLATAKKGDRFSVMQHEDEGWMKVQFGAIQGHVYEKDLSTEQINSDLFAASHDTHATELNAGAGKGFTDEEYAKKANLDPTYFKQMLADSTASLNKAKLTSFETSGNVGPKRLRQQ